MSKDNLDTNRNTDNKFVEIEEERKKRLDREESARKLKVILFVFIPLLVGFLTFTYFFLNSIEEKSKLLKEKTSQNISTANSSAK
ncbi:MAG: hypothetical protein ACE1S7_06370 [Candidatus Tisiphia sp.]